MNTSLIILASLLAISAAQVICLGIKIIFRSKGVVRYRTPLQMTFSDGWEKRSGRANYGTLKVR